MAFEPFQSTFTTQRAVHIPPDLTDDKRAAFIKRSESAVQQQAALADSCDGILRPVGRVRQENDALLIEHEPVAPFDVAVVLSADEHPDVATLWWITWSVLRALSAVEPKRMIHGGLQLRSLFVDQVGRVKLADFGVACAVEAVCGREARRQVVCDAAADDEMAERGRSGSWALLGEEAERRVGWIAPYFAPEILAGGLRLNPTADQFSLGVVLYQIATGVHPLGAELSDPELFGYFVPEPYPLEDERADWAEAFERQERDAAIRADQPILDWAALVYRLLADEPGERFASFAAAEEAARQHVPAAWQEALEALGKSVALLAQGQYDSFLTRVGPWCENKELPALWRARLAFGIAQVEEARATAAARRALVARLDQGYAALDRGQLEEARTIAHEVADAPHADDRLRERVSELEQLCEEHERLIMQRADELARVNLESARQAVERGEFSVARLILTGLREDPLTREQRRNEAEALLAEINEREARYARQQAELKAVKEQFTEGRVTAAWTRLNSLLAEPDLADSLRSAAETLSKEIETAKRQHDECLRVIAEVEAALGRGDPTAAEAALTALPLDTRDPHIGDRRSELAACCGQLRQVLKRRDAAEEQLRTGEPDAALDAARQLTEEELSPALRDQITDLMERCERVIQQMQQARVDDARESLVRAEKAFQAGDLEQFRRLLSTVLPLANRFEDADRARAARLGAVSSRCQAAQKRIDAAQRRFTRQEFGAALGELEAIDAQELPDVLRERIAELHAEVEQVREEYRRRRAQELRAWLEQVAEHLARSEVDKADALLRADDVPPDAGHELHDRYERLREDTVRGRGILESLAAVEAALRDGTPARATRLLDELREPTEEGGAAAALPSWAAERVDELRRRVTEMEQALRLQAVQEAEAALRDARQAIDAADHAAAVKHLATAEAGVGLSPELKASYDELARAAAWLEAWMPKLASVETALAQGRFAVAHEDAVTLLKQALLPAPVEKRLRAAESQARAKVAAHREALSARLDALAVELEQRGRGARKFKQRVETIASDPLAADEQRAKAVELVGQFQALPRRRRAMLPIAASAAVIVVAIVVGSYLTQRGPEPADNGGKVAPAPPEPTLVQGDAREKIAKALERIRAAYAQAIEHNNVAPRAPRGRIEQLPADQAWPTWELYFDPDDSFETTLFARDESGRAQELAPRVTADEIERLELTAAMRERLFPAPETVEATPVEPRPPAAPEWPAMLAARSLPDPGVRTLSLLFSSFAPPEPREGEGRYPRLNPPLPVLAGIIGQAVVGERSAENSFTIRLELKGGAGAASGEFALEAGATEWRPADGSAGRLRGLVAGALVGVQDRVTTIAGDIDQHYREGRLDAAYQAYGQAQELRAAFGLAELTEAVATLNRAIARFPPAWRNPGGYEESRRRDADSGYPRFLEKDGRKLLLVNVAPNDPLWNEIAAADRATPVQRGAAGYVLSEAAPKSPDERKWYVFYIDAEEWTEPVERDARRFARERLERDLPTVEEWLLAALRLRSEADAHGFFGGTWDWCLSDGRPWVCGGCDRIHGEYLPWPGGGAQPAEVWRWLNNPLVSQPRSRGDGLAGVRTVLRVGS